MIRANVISEYKRSVTVVNMGEFYMLSHMVTFITHTNLINEIIQRMNQGNCANCCTSINTLWPVTPYIISRVISQKVLKNFIHNMCS